jgi:N-acyl homoserine lactone hydrolase
MTRVLVLSAFFTGCAVSSHATQRAALGVPRSAAELDAALRTPSALVHLETIDAASWVVMRGGILNLHHPTARAAGLEDGPEHIHVFFHVLRHPTRGTFIVDTGVEDAFRHQPARSAMSWLVRATMRMSTFQVHVSLGAWLATQHEPLSGVFVTHLHPDHVTGLRDVPAVVPVFTGPGEAGATHVLHALFRTSIDAALEGKGPLHEWNFGPAGVLDVFDDGTVWALWVPGHTVGTTAYLVFSDEGPVLLTGDVSHTRWGWDHHVEPAPFTGDVARSIESLERLQALLRAFPQVTVRCGHQW